MVPHTSTDEIKPAWLMTHARCHVAVRPVTSSWLAAGSGGGLAECGAEKYELGLPSYGARWGTPTDDH